MPVTSVSIDFNGKTYSLETGRFAKFANGAVMVRCGDTMVLVTAVASGEEKTDIDYLPLQVEYREKAASAGKFPGGFLKRESRPSEHEILSARLIDRPIRPMLPKNWHFDTQIIATIFSSDPEVEADTLAAVGASAALMISDIPFAGPISEVCVGRINGEFVANPSFEMLKQSDIDMTVAGTDDSICMVEGECNEISEDEFIAALEFGHSKIKELNALQNELVAKLNIEKRPFNQETIPDEIFKLVDGLINNDIKDFVHTITTKTERQLRRRSIFERALEAVTKEFGEKEEYIDAAFDKIVAEIVDEIEKKEMRMMIIDEGKRLDGRTLTQIRPITCEIGVLPRTHGSALFTRGETQSLTTVTLGTKRDEQMIDGLQPTYTVKFILHYNFPPFSTGETGRIGSPGRREIGHGNLAERALKIMTPEDEDFAYTIRVVSDILESNGSSSMATVCAGSLALFDAGVPMKKPVAGIAMGLIKEEDKVAVLSDILGDEDHLGDMDFKVTGTADGITACQMDIKIQGLSVEIMRTALEQARQGRLHILSIMNETISTPREDLSPFAPRFTTIKIPVDCIGAVIGSGGENIRSIVKESGAEIDIEEDGTVMIAATSGESAEAAIKMIEYSFRKPEEGEVYEGVVKEIREGLGAIIEFMPKKSGLLHISQISYERTENVSDVLKVGDRIEVKLLEVTRDGKFRLSRKALLPKPENYVESESRPRSNNGGDRRPPRFGNDDRSQQIRRH
jgi:polyribonucleotide nucleotidyltransferase